MVEIDKLKKVGDGILNSEGMILGLFADKYKNLFLRSILKDGSGFVYYSTNEYILKKYLTSEITLDQVFIEIEDDLITIQYRNSKTDLLKKMDLISLIECGEDKYCDIPRDIRCS
jgi:hypothetical protein